MFLLGTRTPPKTTVPTYSSTLMYWIPVLTSNGNSLPLYMECSSSECIPRSIWNLPSLFTRSGRRYPFQEVGIHRFRCKPVPNLFLTFLVVYSYWIKHFSSTMVPYFSWHHSRLIGHIIPVYVDDGVRTIGYFIPKTLVTIFRFALDINLGLVSKIYAVYSVIWVTFWTGWWPK